MPSLFSRECCVVWMCRLVSGRRESVMGVDCNESVCTRINHFVYISVSPRSHLCWYYGDVPSPSFHFCKYDLLFASVLSSIVLSVPTCEAYAVYRGDHCVSIKI